MLEGIHKLIEVSNFYGKNKEYVIAGGGNTSFKNDKFLWIKASGIALEGIDENGFVCMSREKLKIISEKAYSKDSTEREEEVKKDLYHAIHDNSGKRPSVETSLHNLVNYSFVVHTHPTLVNSLLCSKKAKEESQKLFGENALFIEYTDPGYVLFKKVSDELNNFKKKQGYEPKIILLENHGIIVSADNIEEIEDIYSDIENKILNKIKATLISDDCDILPVKLPGIENGYANYMNLKKQLITGKLVNEFIKDEESFKPISVAFTPDHIVYCKSRYLFLENISEASEKINSFSNTFGYLPKVIAIQGDGLLLIDEEEKSVNNIQELILNMMKISYYARSFGGSKPMTDEQIAFIENWEAENYRKSMSKK